MGQKRNEKGSGKDCVIEKERSRRVKKKVKKRRVKREKK